MKRCKTILCSGIVLAATVAVWAQSNVDATNKHAWGENIGWTNWRDANGGLQGVVIGGQFMSGYVWAENVGWINVGDGTPTNGTMYGNVNGLDFGVNVLVDGSLNGLGWGENVGWINFAAGSFATPAQPAYITCDGRLHGFVWGENIGWLNLNDGSKFVSLSPAATPTPCDMNGDGHVDGADIQAFVNAVFVPSGRTWRDYCSGDIVPPFGTINPGDVNAFVVCLLN